MMRRSHQFVSQFVFASVIAAGAASASPAFSAPPAEIDLAIERTDWVPRCWWVDSPRARGRSAARSGSSHVTTTTIMVGAGAMAMIIGARNGNIAGAVIGMTTTNGDNP